MIWGTENTLEAPKIMENRRRSCSMHGSVVIYRNIDGTSKIIEEKDVLNVKFAEEPTMIFRPVLHVRMTREQCFSCIHCFFSIILNLNNLTGENYMSTSWVLFIQIVLFTVGSLKVLKLQCNGGIQRG